MDDLKNFIKIPQIKILSFVITAGVAIFALSKIYGTIVQGQILEQQKKINKYIIKGYAEKEANKNA